MKKALLFISFSLLLLAQGCGGGGSTNCTRSGLSPGVTYRIYYARPYYPPDRILTRVASSSGTITVPKYDYPSCDGLIYVAVTNSNVSLSASPSSVYLPSPPATATVTGQLFDATYGMPEVNYFDSNGYLVGSVLANSVSGSTSLQANIPDLSNVYSGTYQVRVTNKTSDGYYVHNVGSAPMTTYGRDRADSDGDGWYDDEDCNPWDPSYNYNCAQDCYNNEQGYYTPYPELCAAY